jgi:hypothetical protein
MSKQLRACCLRDCGIVGRSEGCVPQRVFAKRTNQLSAAVAPVHRPAGHTLCQPEPACTSSTGGDYSVQSDPSTAQQASLHQALHAAMASWLAQPAALEAGRRCRRRQGVRQASWRERPTASQRQLGQPVIRHVCRRWERAGDALPGRAQAAPLYQGGLSGLRPDCLASAQFPLSCHFSAAFPLCGRASACAVVPARRYLQKADAWDGTARNLRRLADRRIGCAGGLRCALV